MAKYIGRLAKVGIGREGTRGVGVDPDFWIPLTNYTHNSKATKARSAEGLGNIESPADAIVTEKWAEGDLEFEVNVNSFGLILTALFGTVSYSAGDPEAGVNTHTYSVQNDNQHDSLTIIVDEPNGDLIFERSMVNSVTLTVERDALVMATVNFMSHSAQDTGKTASYTVDYKFAAPDLAFKIAALTGSLTAAAAIPLKSLTLTFEKNLERDSVLGTLNPADIHNDNMTISGSMELTFENHTQRDYMLNGTYRAMRIDLVDTRDTIGAATNPQFTLDFSRVDFEGWDVDRSLDTISTESIDFTALYDFTNGNVINSCTLINTATQYDA